MTERKDSSEITEWLKSIITTETPDGGVLRRPKEYVLRHATLDDLQYQVSVLRYHLIETTDHFLIVCTTEPLIIHC